jgi:S-adenosyl methyltransferase
MTEAPHLPRGAVPDPPVPPGVDPSKPGPARLYDYYLGGHNNFEVDRKAAEAGLRQFIDIGSGLPTVGNTHQVVQRIDPAARVVYADLDPMVAAQSEPLLAGAPNVTLITADLRARTPCSATRRFAR